MKRQSGRIASDNTSFSQRNEKDDNICFQNISEDDQEVECHQWDADCLSIPPSTCIKQIIGYHLMPTCIRDPEMHPRKKMKVFPEMRGDLQQECFFNKLKQKWLSNENYIENNVELICDPFKVCIIENFLEDVTFLNGVREEFSDQDWNQRNMDLYEFFQSEDLKKIDSPKLKSIYRFLKTNVMKWVSNLMDVEFTHISATCSIYTNTDYLLVHDDQREDRFVAFVLYLTDDDGWSSDNGGALQLLASDKGGHPTHVVRDILPSNNQLVLFPVASNSHHQVAEVTTRESCRMSINGWFHTKISPTFDTPPDIIPHDGLFSNKIHKPQKIDIDLHSWINEDYLDPEVYKIINEQIEDNSEICLKNFLKEEPYRELMQLLGSSDLSWKRIGPPNKFCYDVIDCERLPHILERFLALFQSEEMFSLLEQYTELELTSRKASMKYELQKWETGYYALLTDYDWESKNELDLIMYFGVTNKSDVIGGRTQYVTMEDEIQTALITVEPEDNNLNIVYRDTARFTKYVSEQSRCKCFYTLICSYSE